MTSPRTIPRATWHQKHTRSLTFGQRAADVLRNSMGSWRFVFGFVVFMLVWAAVNSFENGWDEYPFILLNLFLSMLAGLQGAILLIAAKRQDGIAAALSQHDFETDVTSRADIEVLLEMNRDQAALLAEMRALLGRLEERPSPVGT
ncbi:Protein of unknown function [Rathayibacter oskolensis]|uniref:DUF1003 domain-containing protein n=1 Tax=Rathayibacter oskolensis TaxID=1891671 RepID=A0A1X7PCA4_9MICO|nr:DUF1003 domain-containing protein [Rathayibacter oskolensis]SMH48331.1 Protein of unknown function [Rathayibacter oskolensis]